MKLKIGKKSGLRYFDTAYIRSLGPCYDPNKYLAEDFRGTALDILSHKDIPFQDKLWVVLRTEILSEKCMRLFAVWSARQVLTEKSDDRSINAVNVAERFANGEATTEELSAAWSAAYSAASTSAAYSAAYSAAWSAAKSAAYSASTTAAWSAAYSAAESDAISAQQVKLVEMVKTESLQLAAKRSLKNG